MVTVYPSTVEREYIVRNGFLHAGMETFNMKRVFLIVLDSVGIGEMPDAADYGDAGSNTIRAVASSPYFSMPNMRKLGFFNIDGVEIGEKEKNPAGSFAILLPFTLLAYLDVLNSVKNSIILCDETFSRNK